MSNTTKTANELIPAISLRGLVVFPAMVLHFDIGRERSVNAVKAAAEGNGRIFLVAQKDAAQTEPELSDIYEVGVIAEVRQLLTTPDGSTRVLVEGLTRAKRVKSVPGREYLQFEVKELPVRGMELSESTAAAAVRALKNTFAEYAQISPRMPRELFEGIMSEENCAELFEKVVFNVVLKVEDKQALLETNGLLRRVKMLISMLESEIEIIETEIDIQEQVKEQVDKNQREYYLREQLRAIYKQLGEGDNPQEEVPADTLPVRGSTLFVAAIPVPASPSGGQTGTPGRSVPVGSRNFAPSAVSAASLAPALSTPGRTSSSFPENPLSASSLSTFAMYSALYPIPSTGKIPEASPTPTWRFPVS